MDLPAVSREGLTFPGHLLTSQPPRKIPSPWIRFWFLAVPTASPRPPAQHLQLPSGRSRSFQAGTFDINLCSFLLQVPRAKLRRSLTKLALADDKRYNTTSRDIKCVQGLSGPNSRPFWPPDLSQLPTPKCLLSGPPRPLGLTILTFLVTSSLAHWLKENIPGAPCG